MPHTTTSNGNRPSVINTAPLQANSPTLHSPSGSSSHHGHHNRSHHHANSPNHRANTSDHSNTTPALKSPKIKAATSFEQRMFALGMEDDENQKKEEECGFHANDMQRRKANDHKKAKPKKIASTSEDDDLHADDQQAEDDRKLEEEWLKLQQEKERIFQEQVTQTRASRYHSHKQHLSDKSINFPIKKTYDFKKSTEENYSIQDNTHGKKKSLVEPVFVGKYKDYRIKLDHTFHQHYTPERQLFQDQVIDHLLNAVQPFDSEKQLQLDSPIENWIVFTVGAMGAGKGHTMKWLDKEGLFPMEAFVKVDPDEIRRFLPETAEYNEMDDNKTASLTQKEVAYISEILTLDALDNRRNILVDASLRNAERYLQYFQDLRNAYPVIKIAVISVEADVVSVIDRAKQKALETGRLVPDKHIMSSLKEMAHALHILVPHSDYYARILNDDASDPVLLHCEMHMKDHTIGGSDREHEVNEWNLHRRDVPIDGELLGDVAIPIDPNEPIGDYVLTTIKRKVGGIVNPNAAITSTEDENKPAVTPLAERVMLMGNDDHHDDKHKKKKHHHHGHHHYHNSDKQSSDKNSVHSAHSTSTTTSTDHGSHRGIIVKKSTTNEYDWKPYFSQAWTMRSALPQSHAARLRRLATLKENEANGSTSKDDKDETDQVANKHKTKKAPLTNQKKSSTIGNFLNALTNPSSWLPWKRTSRQSNAKVAVDSLSHSGDDDRCDDHSKETVKIQD